MVFGIVTLIEGEAGAQVHALWARLRGQLGNEAIAEMTTPHLTYHCADDYDREALSALFERVASEVVPFEVSSPGVGIVAREGGGVTWLNVTRTPRMNELHARLWDASCDASRGEVYDRYAAPTWNPHVTLSYAPVVQDRAAILVEAMRDERLPRTLHIDNLALIEDTGAGHELVLRVGLRGAEQ
ncbi:MAG: 2'-5' RNA ligase family protein [Dehalococcoidia bacterium]